MLRERSRAIDVARLGLAEKAESFRSGAAIHLSTPAASDGAMGLLIERTHGVDDSRGPLYVDAAHNRLWFFPGVIVNPKWVSSARSSFGLGGDDGRHRVWPVHAAYGRRSSDGLVDVAGILRGGGYRHDRRR